MSETRQLRQLINQTAHTIERDRADLALHKAYFNGLIARHRELVGLMLLGVFLTGWNLGKSKPLKTMVKQTIKAVSLITMRSLSQRISF